MTLPAWYVLRDRTRTFVARLVHYSRSLPHEEVRKRLCADLGRNLLAELHPGTTYLVHIRPVRDRWYNLLDQEVATWGQAHRIEQIQQIVIIPVPELDDRFTTPREEI